MAISFVGWGTECFHGRPKIASFSRAGLMIESFVPRLETAEETEIGMPANERIEINPKIMLGKPVIRGTRIPVALILRKLREGATGKDLLDAYPRLCVEDLRAASAYAAGRNRRVEGS